MEPNLDAETACVCVCAAGFFQIYLIIPVTAKRWEPQKMDPNLDAETACVCVCVPGFFQFYSQTMNIIGEHH